MAIQRLNFGTAAPNDGEFGRTAFPKLDSNDAYLEGLISAHETRIDDLETDVTAGVPSGTSGYALIGNGVGNATTFQGFTQAGTGAVTRTWQEKMRESVTPADKGAVGDGVTDDRTAFANAAALGSLVYIPKPGTGYTFSTSLSSQACAWFPDPTIPWDELTNGGQFNMGRGPTTEAVAGCNIWRLSDRVFIGEAASKFAGNRQDGDEGTSWFSDHTTYPGYLGINASLLVTSDQLPYAISAAKRTSDTDQSSICFGAAIIGDAASKNGWGFIAEVQRESGAPQIYGMEVAAKNKGSNGVMTPNTTPSGVYGLWLAGGGGSGFGGAPTNPSTAGVVVLKNQHTWNTGIVFKKDALTSGEAMALSSEGDGGAHLLRWYNAAGNSVFTFRCTATDAVGWDLRRSNSGLSVEVGAKPLFLVATPGSAVNGIKALASATGNAVELVANGDDTNIDLTISGKGTGGVNATLKNTGLHILDTDASHDLIVAPGSNLTADRTLTITTGNADRTLDISAGSVTISAAGAALIDDASADAQRTTLGVGTGDSPQFSAINLGHATDTTIGRTSAGLINVEGVDVVTVSATQTLTNKTLTSPTLTTPALGIPSSGNLSNCTDLSASAVGTAINAGTPITDLADTDRFGVLDASSSNALVPVTWATIKSELAAEGAIREILTAARTYYVRTDGSDSNNGLANTSGGAFLTLQKAVDVVCGSIDTAGYAVTVSVADGTYTGAATFTKGWAGAGTVTFQGNTTTPANVVCSASSLISCSANLPAALTVKGFKHTGSGQTIIHTGVGRLQVQDIDFAGTGFAHLQASNSGAAIWIYGNYSITAAATYHFFTSALGTINRQSGVTPTVTLTGTLAFNTFARSQGLSAMAVDSITFDVSGATVTGQRYNVQQNSVIGTNGGGASYFPGSTAGATSTGGQYT